MTDAFDRQRQQKVVTAFAPTQVGRKRKQPEERFAIVPAVVLKANMSATEKIVYGCVDYLCLGKGPQNEKATTVGAICELSRFDKRSVRRAVEHGESCGLYDVERPGGQKAWRVTLAYNPARKPPVNVHNIPPLADLDDRSRPTRPAPLRPEAGQPPHSDGQRCQGHNAKGERCRRQVRESEFCPFHAPDEPGRGVGSGTRDVPLRDAPDVQPEERKMHQGNPRSDASAVPGSLYIQQGIRDIEGKGEANGTHAYPVWDQGCPSERVEHGREPFEPGPNDGPCVECDELTSRFDVAGDYRCLLHPPKVEPEIQFWERSHQWPEMRCAVVQRRAV